jgi:hypothetical protein
LWLHLGFIGSDCASTRACNNRVTLQLANRHPIAFSVTQPTNSWRNLHLVALTFLRKLTRSHCGYWCSHAWKNVSATKYRFRHLFAGCVSGFHWPWNLTTQPVVGSFPTGPIPWWGLGVRAVFFF